MTIFNKIGIPSGAGGPDNFLLGLQSMSLKLCRVVPKPLHPRKRKQIETNKTK